MRNKILVIPILIVLSVVMTANNSQVWAAKNIEERELRGFGGSSGGRGGGGFGGRGGGFGGRGGGRGSTSRGSYKGGKGRSATFSYYNGYYRRQETCEEVYDEEECEEKPSIVMMIVVYTGSCVFVTVQCLPCILACLGTCNRNKWPWKFCCIKKMEVV